MSIQDLTIWPVVPMHRLLVVLESGARPPGGVGEIKEGIPSLGGQHLTSDGFFDFSDLKYIPEEFFKSLKRGVIEKKDILLVKDGATTGKVALVSDDFPFERAAINEHLFRLRARPELVMQEFLFWFLFSEWGQAQIERSFHGAAIGGITQAFAERVQVPLPPVCEQQFIVDILFRANELRQMRDQAQSQLEQLYQALFESRFGTGQVAAEYPESVRLETLLSTPLTSGYSPSANESPPGIPVFALSALTDAVIDEEAVKYFPVDEYEGRGDDLEIDDILISRSNTIDLVGRVCRYRGKPSPVIYPDLMIRIRLQDKQDSAYVEGFLRSPYMKATIRRLARGTSGSMKKISQGDINAFSVLWPSHDERRSFQAQIVEVDRIWDEYRASQENLNLLLQSLLSRSFSGELTTAWRGTCTDELQKAAAERDRLLGLEEAKPVPTTPGIITEWERDALTTRLLSILEPAARQLATSDSSMSALIATLQSDSLVELAQQMYQVAERDPALADASVWRAIQDMTDSVRQSLANHQQTLRQVTKSTGGVRRFQYHHYQYVSLELAEHLVETAATVLRRPDSSHRRYALLAELSADQYRSYLAVQSAPTYITAASLEEEKGFSAKRLEQDLELLAAAGLIQSVGILTHSPDGSAPRYVQTYRRLADAEDKRADDLTHLRVGAQ